jgi:Zn-dependent oligopeptidase
LLILYSAVDCFLWYNHGKGGEECPIFRASPERRKAMAEKTAAQKRAQKAYMEKFVRVEIRMDAEQRAAVQAHAEAHSESVNGFINRAISETMERDRAESGGGEE